jgi:hypothetical protein
MKASGKEVFDMQAFGKAEAILVLLAGGLLAEGSLAGRLHARRRAGFNSG